MRTTLAAAFALVLVPGAAALRAQETTPTPAPAAEERDADREAARRHLQVLQDPHDISSFYRSGGGDSSPLGYDAGTPDERYPLASFYRLGGGHGRYSQFWTNGYGRGYGYGRLGTAVPRGSRGRGLLGVPRARALGLNGDLCLFAPTFLAPVGPLTGVFFER